MNVNIEGKVPQAMHLSCGDVVAVNGCIYLICEEDKGYIARGFDGATGATGHHESLTLLLNSLLRFRFEYYSENDYELNLVKK